jgi:hypothetical protein
VIARWETWAKKEPRHWSAGAYFLQSAVAHDYLLFFAAFLDAGFAADFVVFFETGFFGDAMMTSFRWVKTLIS